MFLPVSVPDEVWGFCFHAPPVCPRSHNTHTCARLVRLYPIAPVIYCNMSYFGVCAPSVFPDPFIQGPGWGCLMRRVPSRSSALISLQPCFVCSRLPALFRYLFSCPGAATALSLQCGQLSIVLSVFMLEPAFVWRMCLRCRCDGWCGVGGP